MGLGGPVWHVSVSPRFELVVNRARTLFGIANVALTGVGDATLGEWREVGETAVHLRRRLTAGEALDAGIGSVCDVWGTEEFTRRIAAIRPYLPAPMQHVPDEALP